MVGNTLTLFDCLCTCIRHGGQYEIWLTSGAWPLSIFITVPVIQWVVTPTETKVNRNHEARKDE